MIELPAALRPWSAQLAMFPREMALSLGPIVHRLATAIGPMTSDARTGSGEPDGFDGLTRRGIPERLLISDWLMADEVPDEFLRRAASQELGYLQLSRREPRGIRRSVLLLDAGPSQLGTPRIAQLAALLVLARRAEAAHVQFAWGVLQVPGTVVEHIHARSLAFLLDQRGAPEPSPSHLNAWMEALGPWTGADDLWIAGGSRALRLPSVAGASTLEISDVYESHARDIAVTWRKASRVMKVLRLPLPDDRACARLLHAPWDEVTEDASRVVTEHRPTSNLVFCHTGRWAFARVGADHAVAYPTWPASTGNAPQLLEFPFGTAAALGTYRRQFVALGVMPSHVTVMAARRGGRGAMDEKEVVEAQPTKAITLADPLMPAIVVPRSQAPAGRMWAVTSSGELWSFNAHGGHVSRVEAGGMIGVTLVRGNVVTVQAVSGGALVLVRPSIRSPEFLPVEKSRLFLGPALRGHPEIGVLAFLRTDGKWVIRDDAGLTPITIPAGIDVRGVTRPKQPAQSGLVVIEHDRRTIALVTARGALQLFTVNAPIDSVAVNPQTADIACCTERGDVFIYGLDARAMLREFRVKT